VSNSRVVESRVTRDECVTCGWTEFDVREIVAVGDGQDESVVGERYEECHNCGETYDAADPETGAKTSTEGDRDA